MDRLRKMTKQAAKTSSSPSTQERTHVSWSAYACMINGCNGLIHADSIVFYWQTPSVQYRRALVECR